MHKKILSALLALFIASVPFSISSVYAVGENTDNSFVLNYDVKDNIIFSVLTIEENVCIGGFEATLNYDAKKYSVESTSKENADILMNVIPSKGEIVISMASNNNLVEVSDLIRVEFVCSETPIESDFSFEVTDAYMIDENNDLENVEYKIKENWSNLNKNETTTTSAIKETTSTLKSTTTFISTTTTPTVKQTTAFSTTTTAHTAETTTTTIRNDTQISKKNNFIVSVKENKETNNIEVEFLVSGDVEFFTAEGSIKVNTTGLGSPVLLKSIPDSLSSYKSEDNCIYFTVISSAGENITEAQNIFTYAFPIENSKYSISCTGKITDICDQNYNDAEYSVIEKNEVNSTENLTTDTTTSTPVTTTTKATTSTESNTTTKIPESSVSNSSTTISTTYTTITTTEETTGSTESTTSETVTTTENKINVTPYELSNWAENDYYKKTGVAPYRSEYTENENGTVLISLFDEQGNILDTYTVHLKTGKGFNNNGDEVNLPQTGNNSPSALAIAIGSFIMVLSGTYAVKISKITCRKKDEH